MYDLLVRNARLYPMTGNAGRAEATTLAVQDGRIAALGVSDDAPAADTLDAGGQCLLPGLVDCHTHAVFAGNRMNEHAMKQRGASYAEIAEAGGGIVSTVAAVRKASEAELVEASLPRLQALAREGVTSIEIKSGYGLDLDTELKMLRAVARLREQTGLDLHATFLGAHAIPKGMSKDAYLKQVIDEMLPAVAAEGLAEAVDIFVEKIAFDVEDERKLLEAAKRHGFRLRAHTDQLSNLGATALAAEAGALSCDHLEYITEADAAAMGKHGTVAVLLPGAFYFLRETRKPPVELLRQHGVAMAVATDLNPGSSPVASLLTVMHMASLSFGLTPEEALLGCTANAARALGETAIGTLEIGSRADFALWPIDGPEFLLYQLGGVLPSAVFIKGKAQ